MNAVGHVRRRVRQDECALENLLRRDPVCHVDDLHVGRDRFDHAVASSDEVVLEPEVAQEGEEHAAERTTVATGGATGICSSSGIGRRWKRAYELAKSTASTKPSRSWVRASPATRRPAAVAAAVVSGPIETAGIVPPSAA